MVTDYDCWHPDHDHVTVEQVVKVVIANADKARGLVCAAAPRMKDHAGPCKHGCQTALEHAIMTRADMRDPKLVAKLDAVAGRVLRR